MLRLGLLFVDHQQRRTRVCAVDGYMAEVIELLQVGEWNLLTNFYIIILPAIAIIDDIITFIIDIIIITAYNW